MLNRQGDKPRLVVTIFGFACVGIGIWLHTHSGFTEYGTIALIALGGILVKNESLVDLVRAWKGRNGKGIKQRRESSEHEGVEPT